MRSLWNGAIAFGLVTIPVKLYAATERRDLKFNYLHETCRTPIKYQKVCPTCDREVGQDEIVWGHEVARGQYVVLEEEDFAGLAGSNEKKIEILDFVPAAQIDPIFFDRTYFVEAGEGGKKAYALLRRAMDETDKVAVGRVQMRSRETLCAIRNHAGGVLAMATMFFADEVRGAAGLNAVAPEVEAELDPREVEMASRLVESLSREFDPSRYENRRRAALVDLVNARATGGEFQTVQAPAPATGPAELVEALRRSLEVRGSDSPRLPQ